MVYRDECAYLNDDEGGAPIVGAGAGEAVFTRQVLPAHLAMTRRQIQVLTLRVTAQELCGRQPEALPGTESVPEAEPSVVSNKPKRKAKRGGYTELPLHQWGVYSGFGCDLV